MVNVFGSTSEDQNHEKYNRATFDGLCRTRADRPIAGTNRNYYGDAAAHQEAFEKIVPGFEAKAGYKVKMTIGTGVGTKEQAAKGEPFDVFVILPPYQNAVDSGNLVRESKTTLAGF